MTLPEASCKIGGSRRSGPWPTPQGFPVARAGGCAKNVARPTTNGKGTSVLWEDRERVAACAHRASATRGVLIRPHAGDRGDG